MPRKREVEAQTITSEDVGSLDAVLGLSSGQEAEGDKAECPDAAMDTVNSVDTENSEDSEKPIDAPEDASQDGDSIQPESEATGNQEEAVDKPKFENLSELASRYRVPAWHQAALLRFMGWREDKMVSDDEYQKALDALKHRRIGGGRKQ